MSKLPSLSGEQLIRGLKKAGFAVARIKGSHHILIHPDGRGVFSFLCKPLGVSDIEASWE